ncbi:hypothetical protein MK079_00280 [Candidatus Gracilibacteria bacterium]|nr:hypothetical protein [Candidatus Gracilibacteria bacterium]
MKPLSIRCTTPSVCRDVFTIHDNVINRDNSIGRYISEVIQSFNNFHGQDKPNITIAYLKKGYTGKLLPKDHDLFRLFLDYIKSEVRLKFIQTSQEIETIINWDQIIESQENNSVVDDQIKPTIDLVYKYVQKLEEVLNCQDGKPESGTGNAYSLEKLQIETNIEKKVDTITPELFFELFADTILNRSIVGAKKRGDTDDLYRASKQEKISWSFRAFYSPHNKSAKKLKTDIHNFLFEGQDMSDAWKNTLTKYVIDILFRGKDCSQKTLKKIQEFICQKE